jgi:hypothetical protein
MSRPLGTEPQRRFNTVLPDEITAARLHRYCLTNEKDRNDVVVRSILEHLDHSSRSSIDIQSLPSEIDADLKRFCAAHFGAKPLEVVAEALRAFIQAELARDSATRERFNTLADGSSSPDMLKFRRPSGADK